MRQEHRTKMKTSFVTVQSDGTQYAVNLDNIVKAAFTNGVMNLTTVSNETISFEGNAAKEIWAKISTS